MKYVKTDGRIWYKQMVSGLMLAMAIVGKSTILSGGAVLIYVAILLGIKAGIVLALKAILIPLGFIFLLILVMGLVVMIDDWATGKDC